MNDEAEIFVGADEVRAAILERHYRQLLQQPQVYPTRANWQYIIDHRMGSLGPQLLQRYLVSALTPEADRLEQHRAAVEMFGQWLDAVTFDDAVAAVYSDTSSAPELSAQLITEHQLFSAPHIRRLVKHGCLEMAVSVIGALKRQYSQADLSDMHSLSYALHHLPELGRITTARVLLRSSEVYVCPQGHVNDADKVYCGTCGQDIHGLTDEDIDAVEAYDEVIAAVEELLDRRQSLPEE